MDSFLKQISFCFLFSVSLFCQLTQPLPPPKPYDLLRHLNDKSTRVSFSKPFQEGLHLKSHWKKNPGRHSGLPLERKWENMQMTFNTDPSVFLNHSIDALSLFSGNTHYSFVTESGSYVFKTEIGFLQDKQGIGSKGKLSLLSEGKVLVEKEFFGQGLEKWTDWETSIVISNELSIQWESEDMTAFLGHPILVPGSMAEQSLPPNVILIVIDSARKDFYSCYGFPYPITPTQDLLAKDSVLFENPFANGNWTKPSMHSFFHSEYSSNLGLGNSWFSTKPYQRKAYYGKPRSNLANTFRREGYFTKSIMNNVFFLDYTTVGVDLGFHDLYQVGMDNIDTELLTNEAIRFVENPPHQPYFLHFNLNTPHAAYAPPAFAMDAVQKMIPPAVWNSYESPVKRYIGEVYYTDSEIKRFLDALRKMNQYENTLIVVTGDHGELFSPHHDYSYHFIMKTRFGHGETHYDEEISVPWILKPPRKIFESLRERKVPGQSSLIALAPTILGILGIQEPNSTYQGKDYSAFLQGKSPLDPESIIYTEGRMSESFRTKSFKYIRRYPGFTTVQRTADGEPHSMGEELYDLEKDPEERQNIVNEPSYKSFLDLGRSTRNDFSPLLRNQFHLMIPKCDSLPCSIQGTLQVEGSIYDWMLPEGTKILSASAKTIQFELLGSMESREAIFYLVNPEFQINVSLRKNGQPLPIRLGTWGILSTSVKAKWERDLLTAFRAPLGYRDSREPWLYLDPKFSGKGESEKEKEMGAEVKKILETWGYIHE